MQRELFDASPLPSEPTRLAPVTRDEAIRMARIARVLVNAALANECVQEYLSSPTRPFYTIDDIRKSPPVRVEWEQAIAIGDLGSVLSACRNKSWGEGPQVLPLEPDDYVDRMFITYHYRESSRYNQRFEQRHALKDKLGRKHRRLVGRCRGCKTLADYLGYYVTDEDRDVIREKLGLTAREFWRQVHGLTKSDAQFTQRTLFSGEQA